MLACRDGIRDGCGLINYKRKRVVNAGRTMRRHVVGGAIFDEAFGKIRGARLLFMRRRVTLHQVITALAARDNVSKQNDGPYGINRGVRVGGIIVTAVVVAEVVVISRFQRRSSGVIAVHFLIFQDGSGWFTFICHDLTPDPGKNSTEQEIGIEHLP